MDRSQGDEPRQSYVYAIGGDDHRHVKIGYSTNPELRFATIKTASPLELRILQTWAGGEDLESALHKRFAHYRRRGEWFEFPADKDVVEFIGGAIEEITDQPPEVTPPPPLRLLPPPGSAVEPPQVVRIQPSGRLQASELIPGVQGLTGVLEDLVPAVGRILHSVDRAVTFEHHLLDRLMQLERRVGEIDGGGPTGVPGRDEAAAARKANGL